MPEWTGSIRRESAFIPIAGSFEEYVAKLRLDREAMLDDLKRRTLKPSHLAATEEFLDIGLPN